MRHTYLENKSDEPLLRQPLLGPHAVVAAIAGSVDSEPPRVQSKLGKASHWARQNERTLQPAPASQLHFFWDDRAPVALAKSTAFYEN